MIVVLLSTTLWKVLDLLSCKDKSTMIVTTLSITLDLLSSMEKSR